MKKLIRELKMLIADYLLLGALNLYPEGEERESLAINLHTHFETTLWKGRTDNE